MTEELFIKIITYLVQFSIAVTMLQVYLRVNKIWKRKHEREVAESQSIVGGFLLIANCLLWILYYIYVEPDWLSSIDTFLYMFEASIFTLISTGFWVKGQVGMGFKKLIKRAFSLERKEADYLMKKFFKPTNAGIIIDILYQLAMIDDDFDPKEEALIRAFAKEWNIEFNLEKLHATKTDDTKSGYMKLRKSVEDYLLHNPQTEQAAQLKDMMQTMIEADDEVTEEEELISSELIGLIEHYISQESGANLYHVMIVPQNKDHHRSVIAMNPDATKYEISGGTAYSVGSFYSKKYADMICGQYREEKLFTIVQNPESKSEDNSKDKIDLDF